MGRDDAPIGFPLLLGSLHIFFWVVGMDGWATAKRLIHIRFLLCFFSLGSWVGWMGCGQEGEFFPIEFFSYFLSGLRR